MCEFAAVRRGGCHGVWEGICGEWMERKRPTLNAGLLDLALYPFVAARPFVAVEPVFAVGLADGRSGRESRLGSFQSRERLSRSRLLSLVPDLLSRLPDMVGSGEGVEALLWNKVWFSGRGMGVDWVCGNGSGRNPIQGVQGAGVSARAHAGGA